MVALATLVYSRDAFTVQLAANQMKQNMEANCSVSFVVKGGRRSSWRTKSAPSCQEIDVRDMFQSPKGQVTHIYGVALECIVDG
jgi:hypothetical protein